MSNEIKSFSVTKESLVTGGGKRKTRKATAKKEQEGGGAIEAIRGVTPNTMAVRGFDSPSVASTAASTKVDSWLRIPNMSPQVTPQPSFVPRIQAQAGGNNTPVTNTTDKQIKVELKKGGATQKKVHLNPKKHAAAPIHMQKKDKYRKTRKVTLGLVSMKRRVTRAKKMRDKVKDMPIDELKAQLIKKGLIKPSSKAPESVLRQIALDAQIVAGKAL
jgi:hypothetical protein